MKTSEPDRKFDNKQEDILDHFDTSKTKMINEESKRVNIYFPVRMANSVDRETRRTRGSSIS